MIASTGFSNELDKQMIRRLELDTLDECQKHVCILGDEMYIKEGLVYNKSTGKLVGYCDIGDINNHLEQFQKLHGNTAANEKGTSTCNTLAKTLPISLCFLRDFKPHRRAAGTIVL